MKPFALTVAFIWAAASPIYAAEKQSVLALPVKAARFTCSPKHLKDGDTLVIRVSTPHGSDLGVRGPDNRFHFLVFWRSNAITDPPSLVDWDAFRTMPELHLNTRELQAPLVHEGLQAPTLVFTARGRYRILLARNLETENTEGTVNACTVFFEGRAK